MNDQALQQAVDKLRDDINITAIRLKIAQCRQELDNYQQQMSKPDFWQNYDQPQEINRKSNQLMSFLQPWQQLEIDFNELQSKLEVYHQLSDDKFTQEIHSSLSDCQQQLDNFKEQLRFQAEYDNCGVILSIFAGAGGTDAQDWTQMLLRMYSRWADKLKTKIDILSQSAGDEAGLKSVSIRLSNQFFLYGKLKGEHGVHRLVRLSPFNANNLRQTSFAQVEIVPDLDADASIELNDSDLRFDYFKSSGSGGQSVNKTDSAVRVIHLPTNIAVNIQNSRSQGQNKQLALNILKSKLTKLRMEQQLKTLDDLKGDQLPNQWGSQIRNYVLHPYKQVKDLRTKYTSNDVDNILDGQIDEFIEQYLDYILHK